MLLDLDRTLGTLLRYSKQLPAKRLIPIFPKPGREFRSTEAWDKLD